MFRLRLPSAEGALPLAFWALYGTAFFFSLADILPFADIAGARTASALGTGAVLSVPLERLVRSRPQPSARHAGLVLLAAALLGATWAIVHALLAEGVDPFLTSYAQYLFLQPGQVPVIDRPLAFPVVMTLFFSTWEEQLPPRAPTS